MDLTNFNRPTLLVIVGPTAVGKTDFTIHLAKKLNTSIISADSRQFYREMKIGTAAPSEKEMAGVPHFFIGNLSIFDYYNVYQFEQDVLAILPTLFEKNNTVIMTGGSGLYIDAVCHGIDDLPDPDMEIRNATNALFENEGIEALRAKIKELDPVFFETNDMSNHKRMIRAIEVSLQTGKPYSEWLIQHKVQRDFDIVKICLTRPREELFARINRRTDLMLANGWLEEAKNLLPNKHLNALNTVGYKELFDYFEGKLSLNQAIEDIKTHTRRYAKRQMTWFKRDTEMVFVDAENIQVEN
ncbi:MAG: tRNA (adenosine(37)-N6)-dimethylallyltransferase MiaA [Bacteroidales bacterium]|nr:tRNA (adenosine(37)-N6)-dimethylallyltransferase MiaA [Bacteroidales bacterium]